MSASATEGGSRILLSGGLVFDGTGSPPAAADVVVQGTSIAAVGVGLDGDEEIDCRGLLIAPGFVDAHVHLTVASLDLFASINEPFSLPFYSSVDTARRTLSAGVTTVRDAHGADAGLRVAIERGVIEGPTVQVSISQLSPSHGHGNRVFPCGLDAHPWKQPHPGRPDGIVDGADEMRRRVRELVRAGADVIKVATTGGVMSPGDDPGMSSFASEELEALMDEARRARLRVMAHAIGLEGVRSAVEAGVNSIEHGIFLDEAVVEAMVERGIFLVPTLGAVDGVLAASERGEQVSAASINKAVEIREAQRASMQLAVEAGVRIALGTDAPVVPHGTNLDEVDRLIDSGVSPTAALHAATGAAADLLGLAGVKGVLRPGADADVVGFAGAWPDVERLGSRLRLVLKAGRCVISRR